MKKLNCKKRISNSKSAIVTLKLKIKKESYSFLNQAAIEVNQVWNWANATSYKAIKPFYGKPKYLSEFELNNLSAGASKLFYKIGSNTIQLTNRQYVQKRNQTKKPKLRWRKSGGSHKSLGWVPFKTLDLTRKGSYVKYHGKIIRVFNHQTLNDVKWKSGCFTQDSLGDWYLCLTIEKQILQTKAPKDIVGIDLGLKSIATTSDGDSLEAGRFYRNLEPKIAEAQRRGHKRQAKRLHRKAKRCRADTLHKFSSGIVKQYQTIVVGNVSSKGLARTKMAKSVLDSGWSMLKTQLQYKGEYASRCVQIVNEKNTTRTCSACGALTGPTGRTGLVVRHWVCAECGVQHDRDVNAARNILSRVEVPTSVCGNESCNEVWVP